MQIAGGVEHMHHIPMEAGFDPSPRLFYRHSPATLNMGLTAENLALRYRISRKEQDEFALRSHQRAAAGDRLRRLRQGDHSDLGPRRGRPAQGRCTEDQCIRRDTSLEALAALKPAFMPEGGTVTAGNSSPLNVGAAALLIMSEERAKELGLKPKVRIRAMAVAGVDPSVMGIGPVPATHKALERAGLKLEDIDLIEINEAFAAQALAVIKLLKADPEKVNVRGGAIAIGHPLGASGARIATTLIHAMRDRKAQLRPGDHVHRRGAGHRDDLRGDLIRVSHWALLSAIVAMPSHARSMAQVVLRITIALHSRARLGLTRMLADQHGDCDNRVGKSSTHSRGSSKAPRNAEDLPETLIEAGRRRWADDLKEIWRGGVTVFPHLRDIKVRYRETLLSGGWAIFQPLLMTVVFTVFIGPRWSTRISRPPFPIPSLSIPAWWRGISSHPRLWAPA